MKTRYLAAVVASALAASGAQAAALVATHTVTGTPGKYIYTFTITNNIGQGHAAYFIGVKDNTGVIYAGPPSFNMYRPYNFAGLMANIVWIDRFNRGIHTGQTLSGFKIADTAAAVKDSFDFAAISIDRDGGTTYTGGENVGGKPYFNPVFHFTSRSFVAAVPEPATWAMIFVGFGMVGAAARYRRRSAKVAYA